MDMPTGPLSRYVLKNQRLKKEIQDKILQLLANAKGQILEDEVLINTLSDSKVTSNRIAEKMAVAEKTSRVINSTRSLYKEVACRASQLYFCVAQLANIDPMYQYSLEWFIGLYVLSINKAPRGGDEGSGKTGGAAGGRGRRATYKPKATDG